jgi:putative peptidoglycan lipid II flippase
LAVALPPGWTVAAIGLGTSLGVTVSGLWLLVALRRSAGVESLRGSGQAALAAGTGGVVGGACGVLLARAAPVAGSADDLLTIAGVALVVMVVYTAVVAVIDRPTLRILVDRGWLRRAG